MPGPIHATDNGLSLVERKYPANQNLFNTSFTGNYNSQEGTQIKNPIFAEHPVSPFMNIFW